MDEDREITNLGPETPTALSGEDVLSDKKPRKRFIGRRAADAKAAANTQERKADGIEDSGEIQGAVYRSSCLPSLIALT